MHFNYPHSVHSVSAQEKTGHKYYVSLIGYMYSSSKAHTTCIGTCKIVIASVCSKYLCEKLLIAIYSTSMYTQHHEKYTLHCTS